MKVIKRNGQIVDYSPDKIEAAILKANLEVEEEDQASSTQIRNIIKYIENLKKKRILVEDIQDIIEMRLMSMGKYQLAKKYITYRYTRELVRRSNTTDLSIKELINGENEYWNTENSNKNATVVTTQRDYIAGITSTDITRRFLLPEDIVQAHRLRCGVLPVRRGSALARELRRERRASLRSVRANRGVRDDGRGGDGACGVSALDRRLLRGEPVPRAAAPAPADSHRVRHALQRGRSRRWTSWA